jgi:hypothetical protein
MSNVSLTRSFMCLELQSVGRDFIDGVLNMGGSGEGGGISNDAAVSLSSCAICDVFVS